MNNTEVEEIIKDIEKKYGKGSITTLTNEIEPIKVISTSVSSLNKALGVGGLPYGRIIEIFGKQSTGKSTLAAHVVAESQKEDGLCAYIDMENAIDPKYFQDIGVNLSNNFLLSQPDSGDQALGILEKLLISQKFSVIVVDSVAALVPQAELDGEFEDSTIGLQARMMGKSMRRIAALVNKSNTCLIFINQLRDNINAFGYGPKTVTPGGKSLPFYSSVRIELSAISQIKEGEVIIGNRIKAKIIKNKVAPPFKEAEYDIIFGEGISKFRLIIEESLKSGIITKAGAWFKYDNQNVGQGIIKTINFLKENPEILDEIEKQL